MKLPKFKFLVLFVFIFLLYGCAFDEESNFQTPIDSPIVSTPVETPIIISLDMIEIHESPTKTTYELNDDLDISGLKIKAIFSDQTSTIINVTPSMIGFVSLATPGEKTVTITYVHESVSKTTSFKVIVNDDVVLDAPGYKGEITSLRDTFIDGMFGGLFVHQISRVRDFMDTGTVMFVELHFPQPYTLGADLYTLEYYDFDSETWKAYMQFDEPVTSVYDSLIMSFDQEMTLRLKTSGVEGGELVSNVIVTTITAVETTFTGWSLDQSSYISGIASPYVGFGLTFNISTSDISDSQPVEIQGGYSIEWYRVNPYTYQMIKIEDEYDATYITTIDDIGYYILAKAIGDESTVGGYLQVFSMETVQVEMEARILETSNSGFSIGFDYYIDIRDLDNLYGYNTYGGDELDIISITQGSDSAIYVIEVDLTDVNEIIIFAFSDTWVLVSPLGEMNMQWGMIVELTG